MFMYIRLFGSLQIEDGQRWVGPDDLGGRKPKQLLEILLNERGRVVSKDRIVDLLWPDELPQNAAATDRKSTRLNSSHTVISYAVFCLKKKKKQKIKRNRL